MTSNELQQLEFPIEEGKVSARVRGLEDSALPILVLIHGYPQE